MLNVREEDSMEKQVNIDLVVNDIDFIVEVKRIKEIFERRIVKGRIE